ncbi:lamin tail domain-containing protein [Couchioplanes caeruleus]|uniref:Nuclease n=2 Tax=Couchioplanes caeruleus TaxID=56438 RepID=A0A1K0GRA6_9ACTN|nr:lamin tail domain-containing protein [Couchioplanes caeruleus]OJF11771.1 nuclease [Couchioplanes caeruleus subsp. caeruleus]ROP34109.1 lamin tail-like protein [Couchioplanes caeruleus]
MLRRLALVLAVVLGAGVLATPAAAASGSCLPTGGGPRCQVWTGKAVRVGDGDTILVDITGDGRNNPRWIRLINVQAMELTVYSTTPSRRRGHCHAVAAAARLEQLLRAGGGVVRMTAQHASSSSKNRPLRAVQVRIDGQWRDVGLDLLRRGLTLWQPFKGEYAWNASYRTAQARAARDRLNLYDTDACGSGPSQNAAISAFVNYDAEGQDDKNLNGEYVRLDNASASAVPIAGWWVRDSGLRRYTFRAGSVIPAHGSVYVHVGKGRDTATHKYWGLTRPVFDNPTDDAQALGDGAYLFDPRGDMRAWMQYPVGAPVATRAPA